MAEYIPPAVGLVTFLLFLTSAQGKLHHVSASNHADLPAAASWRLYPGLDVTRTFTKPQTVFVFYQVTGGNAGDVSTMLSVNGDLVSMATNYNEAYRRSIGFWTKMISSDTYRFQVFYKSTSSFSSSETDWTSNIIRVFWMDYPETISTSSHLSCNESLSTDNFWRSLDSSTTSLLVPEERAVLALYSTTFTFPSTVSGEIFTQLEVDGCPDSSSACSKGLTMKSNLYGGYAGMLSAGLHQFRIRTRASHDMNVPFCGTPFGQNLAAVVLPSGCKVDKVCPESPFTLTTKNIWTDIPDMSYSLHVLKATDVIAMYQMSGHSSNTHTVMRLLFNGHAQAHTPALGGDKYAGNFNLWYGRLSTGHHYFNVQLRSPATITHNPTGSCVNCGWESRCLTIVYCPV
jgi:hypothetical protein